MPKWRMKACTRCQGDLFIDRDMDGWYEQCLQCSYRRELKDIKELKRHYLAVGADKEPFDFDDEI